MDIIAICNEHKLNLYKDVKSFGKFKKSLESLHQCETKYYVIKKREYSLPENYDSVYYNKKTETLDFFIQEDVEKTMKVKKSFYDMNEEQIQEAYNNKQIKDINDVEKIEGFYEIIKGKKPAPKNFPKIPMKLVSQKYIERQEVKIESLKVKEI